jgi:hypothetical protein
MPKSPVFPNSLYVYCTVICSKINNQFDVGRFEAVRPRELF